MSEAEIFFKALKDFLTKPFLKMALYPFFITLFVMYGTFFIAADFGLDGFQNHVLEVQQHKMAMEKGEVVVLETSTQTYFGKDLIEFLLQYSVTSWIVGFLVYTLGTLFVMMFALFITLVVVGFLTPWILKMIQKKHYPTVEFHGYGTLFSTVGILFKSVLVMVGLLVLFIPLYFIPILNVLMLNVPFYYFFYTLLNADITSTLMTKEEEAIIKLKNGNAFHGRTIVLYLISMIPFVVLFTTVFYVVYLGHGYMKALQKLRETRALA